MAGALRKVALLSHGDGLLSTALAFLGRGGNALGLPRVAESKPGECGEQRSHLTMYTGHCPCCLWRARTGSHGVPGFPARWAEVVWGGGGCREWKVRKAVTVLLVSAEETA